MPRKTPLEISSVESHLCSLELRLRCLGGLAFFSGLLPQELADINAMFHAVGFQPNEYIYHAEDLATRLFVITHGIVKIYQMSSTGRSVLIDIITQGGLIGNLSILGTQVYPDTVQAQTSTCALTISSDDFHDVLDRHPEVTMQVLDFMTRRLAEANQRIFLLSSAPVEKRIAITLLNLAEKLGQMRKDGLLINMPITRETLAEMIASTPETVSRVMSRFQAEGLVRSGRQWVAITDQARLAALAERNETVE